MRTKMYIAGPISNDPDYKQKFEKAAVWSAENGYHPVNPADAPEGLTYKEYIDRGLRYLMECDCICMLPGSENSPGAQLERHYAELVGLPIVEL